MKAVNEQQNSKEVDMEQPKQIDAHMECEEEDIGRDWLKINSNVKIDGFRTGMDASQGQLLQLGFNAGFREALQMSQEGGQLQGVICAQLSYPDMKVSEQKAGCCVHARTPMSLVCNQLQRLLSSNQELISSIPSLLLERNFIEAGGQQPTSMLQHPMSANSSHLPSVKTYSAVKSPDVSSVLTESGECFTEENVTGTSESKGSVMPGLSCEHVCSSKSRFWTQLQNFRMEAQTLGVDW